MLSQPPVWLILLAFVCALGPLVFIHELGHYFVARWFGVGAETFSIGFGREITGWTDKRGTRWKVGWLPLGGYVKFIGDEHEASAPGDLSKLTPEERDRSFHLKPVWQRFLIVLAGPVSNFLLAIAIFAIFFASFGAPSSPPVVGEVQEGSAAATAQLQPGDRILSMGGRETPTFEELRSFVVLRPGETVSLRVQREQQVHGLRKRVRERGPPPLPLGVLGQALVGRRHPIVGAFAIIHGDADGFTVRPERGTVGEAAESDLGALQVGEHTDGAPGVVGGGADPLVVGLVVGVRAVAEVQSCDVHPGFHQCPDGLVGGGGGAERTDDLSASSHV